jgi:membrane protein YqaA with SNARE-associated domain
MYMNFIHRFKIWLENFAQQPRALSLLFSVAFIEASVFPLSVDVPLIAFGVGSPKKSLKFAMIAVAGSFVGGFAGYYIGATAFEFFGQQLLQYYGMSESFNSVLQQYRDHAMKALILSGFTPLPYIAFTITAGFNHTVDIWTLAVGAIIGRTLRFFPVGLLCFFFGEQSKNLITKYFKVVSVCFAAVVVFFAVYFVWLR